MDTIAGVEQQFSNFLLAHIHMFLQYIQSPIYRHISIFTRGLTLRRPSWSSHSTSVPCWSGWKAMHDCRSHFKWCQRTEHCVHSLLPTPQSVQYAVCPQAVVDVPESRCAAPLRRTRAVSFAVNGPSVASNRCNLGSSHPSCNA